MTDQDKRRFAELMTALSEMFGDTVSKPGLQLRFEAMRNFPIEAVESAVMGVIRNRTFKGMPTVAELLEHLSGGNLDDVALKQATDVLEAVKRIGGYESVVFDDPVTMAVIAKTYGGWIKLCTDLRADEEKWFLKDFAKSYGAFARQGVKEFGVLTGRTEQTQLPGYEKFTNPSAMIGNRDMARRIALAGKPEEPLALEAGLEGEARGPVKAVDAVEQVFRRGGTDNTTGVQE